jgi:hypothetical protein
MKDVRWLLPCTNNLDLRAIDSALSQARNCAATLVAVSLCTAASQEQPFLERNTQAQVFLKTVQRAAEKYHVSVEWYQVFTSDVVRSIRLLTSELHCTGLVVVVSEKQGVLLSSQELRYLLLHEQPASLVLIRLPVEREKTSISNLAVKMFSWLHQDQKQDGVTVPTHPVIEEESTYARKSG